MKKLNYILLTTLLWIPLIVNADVAISDGPLTPVQSSFPYEMIINDIIIPLVIALIYCLLFKVKGIRKILFVLLAQIIIIFLIYIMNIYFPYDTNLYNISIVIIYSLLEYISLKLIKVDTKNNKLFYICMMLTIPVIAYVYYFLPLF